MAHRKMDVVRVLQLYLWSFTLEICIVLKLLLVGSRLTMNNAVGGNRGLLHDLVIFRV